MKGLRRLVFLFWFWFWFGVGIGIGEGNKISSLMTLLLTPPQHIHKLHAMPRLARRYPPTPDAATPVRSSHSFHTDRLAALVLAGCDLFKINGVADATARSFVHKYWDHSKSALTNILFLNEMIQSGDCNIGPVSTGTTTFAEAYVGFLFQPVFDIRCSPPILRYASDPDLLGVTADGQDATAFIPPCYRTPAGDPKDPRPYSPEGYVQVRMDAAHTHCFCGQVSLAERRLWGVTPRLLMRDYGTATSKQHCVILFGTRGRCPRGRFECPRAVQVGKKSADKQSVIQQN